MSLVIDKLSKQIDHQPTLDAVSFTVEPGQIIGVIGRNGVGKTTLFRTINGQYLADQGAVLINDQSVTATPSCGRNCVSLIPRRTSFGAPRLAKLKLIIRPRTPSLMRINSGRC